MCVWNAKRKCWTPTMQQSIPSPNSPNDKSRGVGRHGRSRKEARKWGDNHVNAYRPLPLLIYVYTSWAGFGRDFENLTFKNPRISRAEKTLKRPIYKAFKPVRVFIERFEKNTNFYYFLLYSISVFQIIQESFNRRRSVFPAFESQHYISVYRKLQLLYNNIIGYSL